MHRARAHDKLQDLPTWGVARGHVVTSAGNRCQGNLVRAVLVTPNTCCCSSCRQASALSLKYRSPATSSLPCWCYVSPVSLPRRWPRHVIAAPMSLPSRCHVAAKLLERRCPSTLHLRANVNKAKACPNATTTGDSPSSSQSVLRWRAATVGTGLPGRGGCAPIHSWLLPRRSRAPSNVLGVAGNPTGAVQSKVMHRVALPPTRAREPASFFTSGMFKLWLVWPAIWCLREEFRARSSSIACFLRMKRSTSSSPSLKSLQGRRALPSRCPQQQLAHLQSDRHRGAFRGFRH